MYATLGLSVLVVFAAQWSTWRAALAQLGDVSVPGVAVPLALAMLGLVLHWYATTLTLPGLPLRRAAVASTAGAALADTVPAGGAIAVGVIWSMYRAWGFSRPDVARATVLSTMITYVTKVALVCVVVVLAATGLASGPAASVVASAGATGLVVVVAAVAVFAMPSLLTRVVATGERVAVWATGRVGRPAPSGWVPAVLEVRAGVGELLARRWVPLVLVEVVRQAATFACLTLALAATGAPVRSIGVEWLLLAYCTGMLVSSVPVTPGAAGVAEMGYAGVLLAVAPGPAAGAVAGGVVLFRLLTWGTPLLLGLPVLATWRLGASRRLARQAPATVAVAPRVLAPVPVAA